MAKIDHCVVCELVCLPWSGADCVKCARRWRDGCRRSRLDCARPRRSHQIDPFLAFAANHAWMQDKCRGWRNNVVKHTLSPHRTGLCALGPCAIDAHTEPDECVLGSAEAVCWSGSLWLPSGARLGCRTWYVSCPKIQKYSPFSMRSRQMRFLRRSQREVHRIPRTRLGLDERCTPAALIPRVMPNRGRLIGCARALASRN